MARHRADEILESWETVARSAVRPAAAPRPQVTRSALPGGMLAAGAAIVVLLVALSVRAIGPAPAVSPVSSATAGTSLSARPSSSPTESAAASASASTPAVGQTPSPADAAAARNLVDQYTTALVRGDYSAAYAMLAPESQQHWQSLADFTYERSAFFRSVGGRYTIQVWPTEILPLTSWLTDRNGPLINQRHAVLVEVDYLALAGNNAGLDIYIVSPVGNELEIFDVR